MHSEDAVNQTGCWEWWQRRKWGCHSSLGLLRTVVFFTKMQRLEKHRRHGGNQGTVLSMEKFKRTVQNLTEMSFQIQSTCLRRKWASFNICKPFQQPLGFQGSHVVKTGSCSTLDVSPPPYKGQVWNHSWSPVFTELKTESLKKKKQG